MVFRTPTCKSESSLNFDNIAKPISPNFPNRLWEVLSSKYSRNRMGIVKMHDQYKISSERLLICYSYSFRNESMTANCLCSESMTANHLCSESTTTHPCVNGELSLHPYG